MMAIDDQQRGSLWMGLGLLIKAVWFLAGDALIIGYVFWRVLSPALSDGLVGWGAVLYLTAACVIPMTLMGLKIAEAIDGDRRLTGSHKFALSFVLVYSGILTYIGVSTCAVDFVRHDFLSLLSMSAIVACFLFVCPIEVGDSLGRGATELDLWWSTRRGGARKLVE